MSTKYTNVFHCKTLQNVQYFDFWSESKKSGNPGGWPVCMKNDFITLQEYENMSNKSYFAILTRDKKFLLVEEI
jgi:hypothetical protein